MTHVTGANVEADRWSEQSERRDGARRGGTPTKRGSMKRSTSTTQRISAIAALGFFSLGLVPAGYAQGIQDARAAAATDTSLDLPPMPEAFFPSAEAPQIVPDIPALDDAGDLGARAR